MSRVEMSLGSCLRFMRIWAKDLWLNVIESMTVLCGEMGVVLRLKWLLRRVSSCIRLLRENASYSFYSCTWALPPTLTLIVQKWLNIRSIFWRFFVCFIINSCVFRKESHYLKPSNISIRPWQLTWTNVTWLIVDENLECLKH